MSAFTRLGTFTPHGPWTLPITRFYSPRLTYTTISGWCILPWYLIDQSHRYGRHQTACREPAGSYDKTTRTAICFEHKTQYLLIRAPYTRIVVFWEKYCETGLFTTKWTGVTRRS